MADGVSQSQEEWSFVKCARPLSASGNLSRVTVEQGSPVDLDNGNGGKLAHWKKSCWMLWIEMIGDPFTEAMYMQVLKHV